MILVTHIIEEAVFLGQTILVMNDRQFKSIIENPVETIQNMMYQIML